MRDLLVAVLSLALLAPSTCAQSLLGVDSALEGGPAVDDPTARAALDAFLKVYWQDGAHLVSKDEPEAPAARPEPSNPWEWIKDKAGRIWDRVRGAGKAMAHLDKADFWWVPHFMEMALDAYELSGDARDRALLEALRDGMHAHYFWRTNAFNDDLGWWMLASIRAYEVTHDGRWLDDAKMLHEAIRTSKDATFGGGVHWKRDGTRFKNVPINAPFVIASVKLWRATKDAHYRRDALEVHEWMVRTLWHDGPLDDGIDDRGHQTAAYTYNYGTFIGACLAVYDETGDARQLEYARTAARWAIEHLAPGGIVKDEGSGDGAGFKMILTRYLAELAVRPGGEGLADFLDANARAAWEHRRARDSIMGYDWSKPAPESGIQSFTAAAGVDLILQARKVRRRAAPAHP